MLFEIGARLCGDGKNQEFIETALLDTNATNKIKLCKSEVRKIAKSCSNYESSRVRDDDSIEQYRDKVCERFMFIESKGIWDNETGKFVTVSFFKDMLRPMGYLSKLVPTGKNEFNEKFVLVSDYWLADSENQQRYQNLTFDPSDTNPKNLNLAATLLFEEAEGNIQPLLNLFGFYSPPLAA